MCIRFGETTNPLHNVGVQLSLSCRRWRNNYTEIRMRAILPTKEGIAHICSFINVSFMKIMCCLHSPAQEGDVAFTALNVCEDARDPTL